MTADEQPKRGLTVQELIHQLGAEYILPGGAGWEALQQKICNDVYRAFDLPEGLTLEWEQIRTEGDREEWRP